MRHVRSSVCLEAVSDITGLSAARSLCTVGAAWRYVDLAAAMVDCGPFWEGVEVLDVVEPVLRGAERSSGQIWQTSAATHGRGSR